MKTIMNSTYKNKARDARRSRRGEQKACRNGHEYKEGSYYLRTRNSKTSRNCLVCISISNKNRYRNIKLDKKMVLTS